MRSSGRDLEILVVWRSLPDPFDSISVRIHHLLRRSAEHGCRVTLLSYGADGGRSHRDHEEACDRIEIVDEPRHSIVHTAREVLLSPQLLRHRAVPCYCYSRQMQKKISRLLSEKEFDLVYFDRPMLPYVLSTRTPTVMDLVDPVLYSLRQAFLTEPGIMRRIWRLSSYYQHRAFEVPKYKSFDACVTVSSFHRDVMGPHLPGSIFVIPYGVDLGFFQPTGSGGTEPTLIFTGAMSYVHNIRAVRHFCTEVFPLITSRIPGARLLIVGREPAEEVVKLASDDHVTVTGAVEDVRPYFEEAAVAIVPVVTDDGGFKTKILEAMAMAKPIVSTSLGAKGINATYREDIVIEDEPGEFANSIVRLLKDEVLRQRLGSSARKLVEREYSWDAMTDRLVGAFQQVVAGHGSSSGRAPDGGGSTLAGPPAESQVQ